MLACLVNKLKSVGLPHVPVDLFLYFCTQTQGNRNLPKAVTAGSMLRITKAATVTVRCHMTGRLEAKQSLFHCMKVFKKKSSQQWILRSEGVCAM